MATFASVLAMDDTPGNSGSQASGGATATIAVGSGQRIIAINADQDVHIRFGNASVSAVSTDFRIPQNQTFTFATNNDTTFFSLYNGSGSMTTFYWAYLSKF